MQGGEYPGAAERKKAGGPAAEKVDWSEIFDLIASEYGYTWGQFTALTYTQLEAFLGAVSRRRHSDVAINAQIHGIRMEARQKQAPVSDAVLREADRMTREMLSEKRANGR